MRVMPSALVVGDAPDKDLVEELSDLRFVRDRHDMAKRHRGR